MCDYLRITYRMVKASNRAKKFLTCPISQDVAAEPVLNLCDGYVYDKQHIGRWLRTSQTSPMTRARTLPWQVVVFRQVRDVFEAMASCMHGKDFW